MPGYLFTPTTTVKDGRYHCPHCRLILRDAVQTECGHRLCCDCSEEIMRSNGAGCRDCGISILPHTEVYPDKAARREVAALEVLCPNCNWRGQLSSAENHTSSECPFRLIKCLNSGCEVSVTVAEYGDHLDVCQYRQEICTYCHLSIPFILVDAHHKGECQHYPLPCPQCHSPVTLHEYESHLMTTCTGSQTKGCKDHEHMGADCLPTFQARPVQDAHSHEVRSEPVCSGPIKVPGLCNSFTAPRYWGCRGLQHQLQHDLQRMNRTITEVQQSVVFPMVPAVCPLPWQCRRIGEQVQRLGGHAAMLAQNAAAHAQSASTFTQNMAFACHHLENLELMGTNSGEYTYTWKIPNIQRDSVQHNRGIFSAPFYTSQYGYKMCMRVYLDGDGVGKGTHVSLFFSIMRSDHDDFLCWPFKQLVTLTLSTPTASITKLFRPDPSSPSFQKPVRDMNIASGCPKFACQSILHSRIFSHEDSIYVKCQVDLTGL